MKFNSSGHRDDAWFVIALMATAVFFSVRYIDVEHQKEQIASAQHQNVLVAVATPAEVSPVGAIHNRRR